MTYNIQNVDSLESSAQNLATSNSKVSNDADSLQYVLDQIKTNWQNEAAQDLASVISELSTCISNLKNAINPTLTKYVQTMNTLVAETRTTQGKSIQ
ncbi:MAG: hypothetical protein HFH31_01090 [Bacilli bacterium]|nr:hypothetical protein [Bacilli bacterium]